MFSKIYWLPLPNGPEQLLGIMARPRGNDWLADEIRGLEMRKIKSVVCLLEKSEMRELELEEEAKLCQEKGITFIHYPIEDVSVPENEKTFLALAEELIQNIQRQEKLVIHCRMGIGRSSLLAAVLLIRHGIPKNEVFQYISTYRQEKVPDTEQQQNWLLQLI